MYEFENYVERPFASLVWLSFCSKDQADHSKRHGVDARLLKLQSEEHETAEKIVREFHKEWTDQYSQIEKQNW